MLDPETRRKARELGIPGFLEAIDTMGGDSSYAAPSFEEKTRAAIDYAYQESQNRLVGRLIKRSAPALSPGRHIEYHLRGQTS